MFFNYIKTAWRNLWKNRVFSIINITGLALSMACCLIMGIYIWNELHYDNFHTNRNNIYRITEKQNQAGTIYNAAVTPGPLAPALQKDFPEISNTVRFGKWSGLLKNGSRFYEEKEILFTENSVFDIFNFPLLMGNAGTALQSPDEIVITENMAEKCFGKDWSNNPSLLGQTFKLNNEADFKLAGVVKNPAENSSIRFEVLLPLSYLFKTDEWSDKWNSNNYHTYLLLKQETNLPAFEKKIEQQLQVYNGETKDVLQLQPLKKQYLYSKFDFNTDWGKRSDIKYVKIFGGIGLLLLIIACINFINLSTARSLKRSVEVGVRKINGASRQQLVIQFLSESIIIAMFAGIAALVIVQIIQPFIQSLYGIKVATKIYDALPLTLLLLLIIIIGLIAGVYPAFILSAYKPISILKNTAGKKRGRLFHKGLVVFQFAVSIVLIICTVFMYRQFAFMRNKDLGFDKEQLISVRLKGQLRGKAALFQHDLNLETSIAATAPATMNLVNVQNSAYMEWDDMREGKKFLITHANVDPDFIPALGIQLINGRNFSRQKTNDTVTFIVNEAAVSRMGFTADNIIGRKANYWGAKGTIIGVVKDFHFKPLTTGVEPFILSYQPQDPYFNLFVKTVPSKTAMALAQLQKIYKRYESETAIEFSFVNEDINELYTNDKRTATIILFFACLTVFVGCLGLFGLTVFAAEQRVKEIGIRKVLGAGMASITQLLSKDFIKLVLLSIVIASPVAWWLANKWLQDFAYRTHINLWVFTAVTGTAIVIAILTVSLQAIKAAMANPVKSLRTE